MKLKSVSKVDDNMFEAEAYEELSVGICEKQVYKEARLIYTIQKDNGQHLLNK